jgi:hypothetical protein
LPNGGRLGAGSRLGCRGRADSLFPGERHRLSQCLEQADPVQGDCVLHGCSLSRANRLNCKNCSARISASAHQRPPAYASFHPAPTSAVTDEFQRWTAILRWWALLRAGQNGRHFASKLNVAGSSPVSRSCNSKPRRYLGAGAFVRPAQQAHIQAPRRLPAPSHPGAFGRGGGPPGDGRWSTSSPCSTVRALAEDLGPGAGRGRGRQRRDARGGSGAGPRGHAPRDDAPGSIASCRGTGRGSTRSVHLPPSPRPPRAGGAGEGRVACRGQFTRENRRFTPIDPDHADFRAGTRCGRGYRQRERVGHRRSSYRA